MNLHKHFRERKHIIKFLAFSGIPRTRLNPDQGHYRITGSVGRIRQQDLWYLSNQLFCSAMSICVCTLHLHPVPSFNPPSAELRLGRHFCRMFIPLTGSTPRTRSPLLGVREEKELTPDVERSLSHVCVCVCVCPHTGSRVSKQIVQISSNQTTHDKTSEERFAKERQSPEDQAVNQDKLKWHPPTWT